MIPAFNQIILFILPLALTLSCLLVFNIAAKKLGKKWGYLTGFLFYWILWCIMIPILLIGFGAIVDYFRPSLIFDHKIILCLISLLIFVYVYAFPKAMKEANSMIIFFSCILAFINATLEEVLWRATYLQTFSSPWFSIGFASLGFAIWHYAPQIILINKNPGGVHSIVVFALILGLCYSYVAFRQQSIFWTTVAHTMLDFAGLGAIFYFK